MSLVENPDSNAIRASLAMPLAPGIYDEHVAKKAIVSTINMVSNER